MAAIILRPSTPAVNVSGLRRHYPDDLMAAGTLMLFEPGSPINPTAILPTAVALNSGQTAVSWMSNHAGDAGGLLDASDFGITGAISGNTLTVTAAHASRGINLGDRIAGAGAPDGLYVRSFGTGTGGTGTYILSGSATVSSAALTVQTTNGMLVIRNDGGATASNLDMQWEYTAKGGLHVITSQSSMAALRVANFGLPGPIKDYMFANPAHEYAWSVLYETTRADATNTGPYAFVGRGGGINAGWINMHRSGPVAISGQMSVVAAGARNTVGLVHERASNVYAGTALTSPQNLTGTVLGLGQVNGSYGDHARNKAMSAVIYRIVLEDLTVSARSLAQFGAVDDAMRAAMFAPGGRYYGDSWTDPATFP